MREKLRFRPISKLRFLETEEYQKEVRKGASKSIESKKETQQYLELPIYDISFEQISFSTKFESLNTEVREGVIKRTIPPLFDTTLTRQIIKPVQTPATGLIQVSAPKETLKIADIKLSAARIEQLSPLLNTDIARGIQMNQTNQTKIENPSFDLEIESKTILKQNSDLDTELTTTNIESGIETLASSEEQTQLPIFEEFINCDKRFPRSFSESFNSPIVVLIGEDEYEWHIPIMP